MSSKCLLTMSVMAILPVSALSAQVVPTHVDAVNNYQQGKKVLQHIGQDDQIAPAGTVIYDTLYIVDTGVCDTGNGNAISGRSVFGVVYDLQLADDFQITGGDTDITLLTFDYLNFNGGGKAPGSDALVEFFADLGGAPDNLEMIQLTGTSYAASTINVSWWGACTRLTVDIPPSFATVPNGITWTSVVPVDTSSGGDWYYTCRQYGTPNFGDSHGRDGGSAHGSLYGGPYGGGYGISNWTSMGALGFTAGNASMRVEGDPAGPSLRLAVTGGCPGKMDACVTGAKPGANVGFAWGFASGSSGPVPGCPGLYVDIKNAKLAGVQKANGLGEACLSGNVPPVGCGRAYVQAIDTGQCITSNVVGI